MIREKGNIMLVLLQVLAALAMMVYLVALFYLAHEEKEIEEEMEKKLSEELMARYEKIKKNKSYAVSSVIVGFLFLQIILLVTKPW